VIRDVLERSIDELPDEVRIVFVACVVDGLTPEQCAELFALTSETAQARLHNARNLLVEVLIRQFGPAFGGVYELDDRRSARITNAVMDHSGGVPRLCFAHHGVHLLQVTTRFRLVKRFSNSGKNRTALR
jgi:RNA polymerase sigma-70 factor (ECF subfamily)